MKFIDPDKVIEQLTAMLNEARLNRDWGGIEVDLKDGRVVLLRTTKQFKIADEENPNARASNYARR